MQRNIAALLLLLAVVCAPIKGWAQQEPGETALIETVSVQVDGVAVQPNAFIGQPPCLGLLPAVDIRAEPSACPDDPVASAVGAVAMVHGEMPHPKRGPTIP